MGVSWNEQKRLRKVSWKFEDTDLYIEYKYIYIMSVFVFGGVLGGELYMLDIERIESNRRYYIYISYCTSTLYECMNACVYEMYVFFMNVM